MRRKTIENPVELKGIALHSGKEAMVSFRPAQQESGIIFIRTDLPGKPMIKASAENVIDTKRGTTLGQGQASIAVVEHVLACLYALSISDIVIEVSGPELPCLDGSALPFFAALKEAGTAELTGDIPPLKLAKEIVVLDGESVITACPSDRLKIRFMVDFTDAVVKKQEISFTFDEQAFEKEIAAARTFGFVEEIDALKKMGLALGASLDNALAIGKDGYVNKPRFKDEVVRHKVLDLIGDLSLVGRPIEAEILAERSSHRLNTKLALALKKEK
jgi:UDP-3-O-[3-hydroxymyristoyl] N-acetylglucosamine deacetylase